MEEGFSYDDGEEEPRYEQIKILFDPVSIERYRTDASKLRELRDLWNHDSTTPIKLHTHPLQPGKREEKKTYSFVEIDERDKRQSEKSEEG